MIVVDSREHPREVSRILEYFVDHGIDYIVSKLIVGDYMIFKNPDRIVDRKHNIAELAKNCTTDHKRFRDELERAADLGVELIILVEQDRYWDRGRLIMVRTIEDLMLWESKYSTIRGERIYRILSNWCHKYPVRVEFCNKSDTGRRIMEILEDEREE